MKVTCNDREFAEALRRYWEVSRKDLGEVLRKKLGDWCFEALKRLRGELGRVHRMPAFPDAGARGAAKRNWRLVRWLAARRLEKGLALEMRGTVTRHHEHDRRLAGKNAGRAFLRTRLWVRDAKTGKIRRGRIFEDQPDLTALARKEQAARNKSKGYLKSVVIAAKDAVRGPGHLTRGGNVARGAFSRGMSNEMQAAVQVVTKFREELTRAMRPRLMDGANRRIQSAFDAARAAVVADMRKYIARKLAERAKKEGLAS